MRTFTILATATALAAGLALGTGASAQAVGKGKFCGQRPQLSQWECKYATMAACDKYVRPFNGTCKPRAEVATVGSKMKMK